MPWQHPFDDPGEQVGEVLGGFDPRVEGDGATQAPVADRFGDGHVPGECLGVGSDVGVGFDDATLVDHLLVGRIVDADDDDPVVAEQVLPDGFAEAESVGDRAEGGRVVH